MRLFDHARSSLTAGRAREALEILAQLTRQFPEKHEAEKRRDLLQLICASPSALGAPECASLPPGAAPD
jgi:hypothetical protein